MVGIGVGGQTTGFSPEPAYHRSPVDRLKPKILNTLRRPECQKSSASPRRGIGQETEPVPFAPSIEGNRSRAGSQDAAEVSSRGHDLWSTKMQQKL